MLRKLFSYVSSHFSNFVVSFLLSTFQLLIPLPPSPTPEFTTLRLLEHQGYHSLLVL